VTGELDEAEDAYRRSLETFREFGDRRCIASALRNLGTVARLRRQVDRAGDLVGQSLAIRVEIADQAGIAECLAALGGIAIDAGRPTHGTRLLGAARSLCDRIGFVPWMGDVETWAADSATAGATLGSASFDQEFLAGHGMSTEAAVRLGSEGCADDRPDEQLALAGAIAATIVR
jgi:hypothetical protein